MTADIKNVVMFVADALRWDHLPEAIATKGPSFKTVAQGCKTAISFPTLATGLRPQQHGVSEWGHRLPDEVFSIFRSESLDTGFFNSGRSFSGLCPVVGAERERDLSNLEPPFFYMERDNNTHSPYSGEFESLKAYFKDRGNDIEQIKRDYRNAVERIKNQFEKRITELEDRGILEETLVVFTSDHGELLGEYGELDHGAPICPELAYVPTVFIHPGLSEESFNVNQNGEVLEHVDITKTALSAIGHDRLKMSGTDLLSESRTQPFGYCYTNERHRGRKFYEGDSIWWHDGGCVFATTARSERLLYLLGHAYKSNRRRYLRRNLPSAIQAYVPSTQSYGTPPVSEADARDLLNDLLDSMAERESITVELDEDAKSTLQDLGYLQ